MCTDHQRQALAPVGDGTGMERFVLAIVVGGVVLVAGLWLVGLFGTRHPAWLIGLGLILTGSAGLSWGIWTELDY